MAEYKRKSDPQLAALKVPPHSVEAEQSVLGGLMLENQAWDKVADRLQEKDFYRLEHQIIFRAIASLANQSQPFDWVTLTEELKKINELNTIGGDSYLVELLKNTP